MRIFAALVMTAMVSASPLLDALNNANASASTMMDALVPGNATESNSSLEDANSVARLLASGATLSTPTYVRL